MSNTPVFNLHRPGARAELCPTSGALRLLALTVVEFLAPGRVTSLGVRGDLPLKPNVIYRAHTGVSAAFPFPFLSCLVRADDDGWRCGVEVKRLTCGERGELIVFFTVLEPLRLDQTPLIFEVREAGVSWTDLEVQQGAALSLPGIKIALEPVSKHRIERAAQVPVQAPANGKQMSDVEAKKRADEWLNSPDDKGRVVSGTDQVSTHAVERPAVVTAAVAPKDMSTNTLRRGVVPAPLRVIPSEIAGDGQPPVSDLKEEFTMLAPQAETAADPLASL